MPPAVSRFLNPISLHHSKQYQQGNRLPFPHASPLLASESANWRKRRGSHLLASKSANWRRRRLTPFSLRSFSEGGSNFTSSFPVPCFASRSLGEGWCSVLFSHSSPITHHSTLYALRSLLLSLCPALPAVALAKAGALCPALPAVALAKAGALCQLLNIYVLNRAAYLDQIATTYMGINLRCPRTLVT